MLFVGAGVVDGAAFTVEPGAGDAAVDSVVTPADELLDPPQLATNDTAATTNATHRVDDRDRAGLQLDMSWSPPISVTAASVALSS